LQVILRHYVVRCRAVRYADAGRVCVVIIRDVIMVVILLLLLRLLSAPVASIVQTDLLLQLRGLMKSNIDPFSKFFTDLLCSIFTIK